MMRRRQHQDEEERAALGDHAPAQAQTDRGPAPGRDPAPGEPAATLLGLQARAGNAAVAGLVAGEGPAVLRQAIQREGTEEVTGSGAASPESAGTKAVLTIAELKAPVPLVSFSLGNRGGDVRVTIAVEDFDQELFNASMTGKLFPTAVITAAGARVTLSEVMVTSVQVSPQIASVTLIGTSMSMS
jgi:hypothetical protein